MFQFPIGRGQIKNVCYECVCYSAIRFLVNLKNEIEITKAEFRFSF